MSRGDRKYIILLDSDRKDYTGLGYSYARALEQRGNQCKVMGFNVNIGVYRFIKFSAILRRFYLAKEQRRIIKEVSEADADVVFAMKVSYLHPNTLKEIKKTGKTVICFNPDNPFGSIFGYSNSWVKACIPLYDAYFIWHYKLVEKLKSAGCKEVFYLPFAADTDIMKLPTEDNSTELIAVSFIGNADNERIGFIEELAAKVEDVSGKKVVFGKGWKQLTGFESNGAVFGHDYLAAMHNSKINLNILRIQNKNAHNMRTFEVPAAGGFLLHEYSPVVEQFFEEGVEMEFYRDVDECARKIIYYDSHEEERSRIARTGYQKVMSAGYHYHGLVNQIEDVLSQLVDK